MFCKMELIIRPFDWQTCDIVGDDGTDQTSIYCWAHNRASIPCLVRYDGFPIYCQVELPTFINRYSYKWTKSSAEKLVSLLEKMLGDDAPTSWSLSFMKKLYHYRGERTYPMLMLSFKSANAMTHCENILKKAINTTEWGYIKCNVWESKISPIRKLLTVQNINFCQWFKTEVYEVDDEDRVSTCKKEYKGDWTTMVAIPDEECYDWTTSPGVLAFDIETYSDRHTAMPVKYKSLHVAYMISCIYQIYGKKETRKKYGIVIGECESIEDKDTELIHVKDEMELVEEFAKIIRETDPDIITGYNILSYDYPYLDHRISRKLNKWPFMGRLIGKLPEMKTKTWKSKAYGYQQIHNLVLEGRIAIDMLPVIKREFKLDAYDLNSVSKKFIGKTKHPITAAEMFTIYEEMQDAIKSGDIEKIEKTKEKTTKVMKYCIQDSELVIDLMEKLNLWYGITEMSAIVGVTIYQLYTSGQQVRCQSQIYNIAANKGYVLDYKEGLKLHNTGGAVRQPEPGLYDNIICLDFSSMYPSIIIAMNICYTTYIPPEHHSEIADKDCYTIDFYQDENETQSDSESDDDGDGEIKKEIKKKKAKIVQKHYVHKFYKNKEGLLPCLVRTLILKRKMVRKTIYKLTVESDMLVYKRQIYDILKSYSRHDLNIVTIDEARDIMKKASTAHEIGEAKNYIFLAQLLDAKLWSSICDNKNNKEKDIEKFKLPKYWEDVIKSGNFSEKHTELLDLCTKISETGGDKEKITNILDSLETSITTLTNRISDISVMLTILDKRQAAIKVAANSMYGLMGVKEGGVLPLPEGAMSVTAHGRMLIGQVANYVETKYGGKIVYGDTDSVMVSLPSIKGKEECAYWGTRLAQEITGLKKGDTDCDGVFCDSDRPGLFPPPLGVEYEKGMKILCLRKKHYAALIIDLDGNYKTDKIYDTKGNVIGDSLFILKKGIVPVRRDNCKLLRKTYVDILNIIFASGAFVDVIKMLAEIVRSISNGTVDLQDLVISKALGDSYKNPNYPIKLFSENLKKDGILVSAGDRLRYVVANVENATYLGDKMVTLDRFAKHNLQIDNNYYLEMLSNSIDKLLSAAYKDTIQKLPFIKITVFRKKNHITLDTPFKMMAFLAADGVDPMQVYHAVNDGLKTSSVC